MARKSKQAIELESQMGELELKLASQSDLLKKFGVENDELKTKVRDLTSKIASLLKEKADLQLTINRLSSKKS